MDSDLTWRSCLIGLSESTYSFALRCLTDSLPTNNNLCLWGKVTSPKCHLCGSDKETLHHILNHCSRALERYKWRHDNILVKLSSFLQDNLKDHPDSPLVKSDVRVCDNKFDLDARICTLPADIIQTSQRPDIVITNRVKNTIDIIELTVPYETNFQAARERKAERYSSVIASIAQTDFKCNFESIEVGARGVISHGTSAILKRLTGATRQNVRQHMRILSQTVLKCSYLLFIHRNNPNFIFDFVL